MKSAQLLIKTVRSNKSVLRISLSEILMAHATRRKEHEAKIPFKISACGR
jgi:hypothetical protein